LIAIIYIEYQRKPKLSFGIEDPPCDVNYVSPPFPVKEMRAEAMRRLKKISI
jgi:hypothetical protein